jgi:DNA-binding response OmpR family regulator
VKDGSNSFCLRIAWISLSFGAAAHLLLNVWGLSLLIPPKKRIALLIENVQLSETLRLSLEDEGYIVISLAGLTEDLRVLKNKEIDMLIVDLDIPFWEMDFVKEVKKIMPTLPIVSLSSFEENIANFLFSEIKAEKILIKPFELEEFSKSINSILNGRTWSNPGRREKDVIL